MSLRSHRIVCSHRLEFSRSQFRYRSWCICQARLGSSPTPSLLLLRIRQMRLCSRSRPGNGKMRLQVSKV